MNNLFKKVFTFSVVATTIMWSLGVAALVPAVAQAEDVCTSGLVAGDMVKVASQPTIYVLDSNMKVASFINNTKDGSTYFSGYKSWNADNNYSFKTVTFACIEKLGSSPKYVGFRPGSQLVKHPITGSLYATGLGRVGYKLSADLAKQLYGSNYKAANPSNQEFGAMFDSTADWTEAKAHPGMLVSKDGKTYLVDTDKTLVEVSAEGLTANRVKAEYVRTLDAALLPSVGTKAAVTAYTSSLGDRSQSGVASAGTGTVASGALTVSLSANTAAATTLSASTVYNSVLSLNLSAGPEAVTVKGLTLKKTGLVGNNAISGVSIWVDGVRKGDVMSSFNSDAKVTVGFGNDPIVVPAGSSKTVVVALNLDSTYATSGTVSMQLEKASDVSTTASVGGTYPISGNTFSLTDGASTLASVKVEGQSVGGVSSEPTSGNVEIGETKEIAKYKFTESGTNNATIEKLVFYVEGSVKESDLKNFELYAPDNTLLGSAASFSDKYLTIKLNTPYNLPKGTNRTLTLKATVMDGSGNWFRIQLQNDSDLLVKDGAGQFYVLPYDASGSGSTWNGSTAGNGACTNGYFEIKAGTLTITKSTSSPTANVAKGTSGVLLGNFDVKAVGEAVQVRKLTMYVATTSPSTRLSGNVTVVVDGQTVLTQSAAANAIYADGTQYTLSQYVDIGSGQTKVFSVYGDIDAAANSNSTYQPYIGKAYVKRMSSLDYVDTQPNQMVAANALALGGNTPSIAKDTTLGNRTIAPGATQVLGQWVVKAPEAEDIELTGVQVDFSSSGLTVANDLQNLALYSGTAQLGNTVSVVASSSNSFTFNLLVPKNTTKTLTLKGYIISSSPTNKTLTAKLATVSYLGKTTNSTTDDTNSSSGYTGQVNTVDTATIAITAASDSTTASKVLTPSATEVQLGKWKVTVNNADTTFNKIRFYLDDGSALDTDAGNFGGLSLYEEGVSTALAASSYISGSGYVEFTGINWAVPASSVKYLVLKGTVNGSGTMDVKSYDRWFIGAANTTNYDVTSGGVQKATSVSVTSPSSTMYLFHNSAPQITNYSLGTSLALNSQAKVFAFTVKNLGDREMTFTSTSVALSVSGLTNSSGSTGTISGFKLLNLNSDGSVGTTLANNTAATTCLSGGAKTGCTYDTTATLLFTSFGETVTIPAGGSRAFVVVADTTGVLNGKSQGTVSVSGMLDGSTGYSAAGGTNGQLETNWSNGALFYQYTPVNGNAPAGVYGASDSYDVVGDTLTRSA